MLDIKANMPHVPWLADGDFNLIRSREESFDYFLGMPCSGPSQKFSQCSQDLELLDLNSAGPVFTWTNKRTFGFIARMLDRILVNTYWLQSFPELAADFTPPKLSDHYAGRLYSNRTVQKAGPFKFFNLLIHHREFHSTVQGCWSFRLPFATQMYQLCRKLKAHKNPLRSLCKSSYSGIHSRITTARDSLLDIQAQLLSYPLDALSQLEKATALKLSHLIQVEAAFLKQKSRIH